VIINITVPKERTKNVSRAFRQNRDVFNLMTSKLNLRLRLQLVWDVTQGRLVVTDVSGQPIGPIYKVKQSKKNVASTKMRSYIWNGVGSDWFSANVTLANRVSGACRTRKGGRRGRKSSYIN
jgi:hypothetical protein